MGEVVDSIVAELIVQGTDKYERNFDRATAAHGRFTKSIPKFGAMTGISSADAQKYVDRHKTNAGDIAKAEEAATAKVTRTRKVRADAGIAEDARATASAKRAAKEQADAVIAEARREAAARTRIAAMVDRSLASGGVRPGSGSRLGATVPREGSGQRGMPASVLGAEATVAAEAEVNHLLADQAILQAKLGAARGHDRDIIKEQIGELRLIGQLQRAGLTDEEIALRLDKQRLLVEADRGRVQRSNLLGSASKFAEGAGLRRTGGGGAAIAGIAAAVGIGIGVEVIQGAINYGKALSNLSDQLGITVEDLQAYQKIARDAGVTQEQLSSAFGQFASNLGRAQQGEREQQKIFKALGVDIRDFASAGDALPTIIDRISSIKDPAQRAAIETRLFGESGRKLDSLLSGGAERVSELARALQETGRALSAKEIQELDNTARKLAEVKSQLQVDFARVVAGNADAIMSLAGSFASLVEQIGGAIQSLRDFGAQQILSGGPLGNLPFQASRDTVRRELLGTSHGRDVLRQQNNQDLDKALGVNASNRNTPETRNLIRGLLNDTNNGVSPRQAEVRRLIAERREIGAVERQGTPAITPPVRSGAVNPNALRNLGTPAGPRGKSAEQLAKEADQRQRRFEDELARSTAELLSARRQLTGNAQARLEIDQLLLETEHKARLQEIDREANEKQIDRAKVDALKFAEDAAYAEKRKLLALEHGVQIENDANNLRAQALQTEIDLLSLQEGLATTAKERGQIARARLAKERALETDRLDAVINSADPKVSEGDRAAARATKASQEARFAARGRQEDRQNQGPLKSYLDTLPRTVDQLDEALQSAAANGLQALNSGLDTAIQNMLHLHGAAGQFIADLIRIAAQHELLKWLDGGSGSAGQANSFLSQIGSFLGMASGGPSSGSGADISAALSSFKGGLPGFATGAAGIFGGRGGLDQNVLSLNGQPFARVNRGEPFAIGPNVAASNTRAAPTMRGGDVKHYHVSVRAENSVTPAGFAAGLAREILQQADRMDDQRQGVTLRATPGAVGRAQEFGG